MSLKRKFFSAKNVTGLAVLLALVIVLQVFGGNVKIGPLEPSFVLIPVVLGGVLFGAAAGGLLGFVFGLITLIYGIVGASPFTAMLFADHPVITSCVCLVKGTAAGLLSGWIFGALKKKKPYAGIFAAAGCAPVVNTGLFILGALFMSDTLGANADALGFSGHSVLYFLIIGCAGFNFLAEFAINLVASPALYRVICVVDRGFFEKTDSAGQTDMSKNQSNDENDVTNDDKKKKNI